MGRITYADKVGIIPKTVHVNQWWDDDANEVKAAINDNDEKIADVATGTRLVDVSAEWTSGLSFDVRADAYPISSVWYSATAATVTLATAHATLDRIDLLIATSSSTVDKITGTASATPNPPDYDPSTQYPIKFVLVKAAQTTPDGVSTELMYDEDVGTPTEWAATENTAAARINTGSTNDAYSGTKSVEFTSSNSSDFLTLTRASTVSSANINLITFWVKLKADFGNKYIFIKFFDSAQQIGGSTSFKDGQFGFDSSSLNWQKISIDGSHLSLPNADIDIMTFAFLKNAFTGAYVDLFEVHTGSGSNNGDNFVEEAPVDGTSYARQDGQWVTLAGGGDMLAATYDPTAVAGDAFDMDNMANMSASKTTPIDADNLTLWDTITSSFRKVTWANIKATLKTYFDTLYAPVSVTGETVKVSANDTTAGYLNGKLMSGEGVILTEFDDASDESLEIKTISHGISGVDVDKVTAVHAESTLTIPTYDGGGQATHPSVVYVQGGWNSYEYWMAMTPYPNYDQTKENPSILQSNDGITWTVPATLTNPIITVPTPPEYTADANLLLGYDDKMYCYFRRVPGGTITNSDFDVCSSSDGATWSSPTNIITTTGVNLVSPSVIKEGNNYYMYYVDVTSTGALKRISSSSPDSGWSLGGATSCTIANMPSGFQIWHMEVSQYNGEYHLIANIQEIATPSNIKLYIAKSTNGTAFTLSDNILLDAMPSGGWADQYPYKATVEVLNDHKYGMWYSGVDGPNPTGNWGIGYTEVNLTKFNAANEVPTATAIDLSNPSGTYYNMASANSATTYTTVNEALGGFAAIRINAASEPTVTGGTKISGDTFASATDMHLFIQYFGQTVQFFFAAL